MGGIAEIGLGLSALGSVASFTSARSQAKYQAAEAERNAQLLEVERTIQNQEIDDKRRRLLAQQKAQYSANGISLDSPTVGALMADTVSEFEKEKFNVNFNADQTRSSLFSSAANIRRNGNAQAMGSLFNLGGTVMNYARSK